MARDRYRDFVKKAEKRFFEIRRDPSASSQAKRLNLRRLIQDSIHSNASTSRSSKKSRAVKSTASITSSRSEVLQIKMTAEESSVISTERSDILTIRESPVSAKSTERLSESSKTKPDFPKTFEQAKRSFESAPSEDEEVKKIINELVEAVEEILEFEWQPFATAVPPTHANIPKSPTIQLPAPLLEENEPNESFEQAGPPERGEGETSPMQPEKSPSATDNVCEEPQRVETEGEPSSPVGTDRNEDRCSAEHEDGEQEHEVDSASSEKACEESSRQEKSNSEPEEGESENNSNEEQSEVHEESPDDSQDTLSRSGTNVEKDIAQDDENDEDESSRHSISADVVAETEIAETPSSRVEKEISGDTAAPFSPPGSPEANSPSHDSVKEIATPLTDLGRLNVSAISPLTGTPGTHLDLPPPKRVSAKQLEPIQKRSSNPPEALFGAPLHDPTHMKLDRKSRIAERTKKMSRAKEEEVQREKRSRILRDRAPREKVNLERSRSPWRPADMYAHKRERTLAMIRKKTRHHRAAKDRGAASRRRHKSKEEKKIKNSVSASNPTPGNAEKKSASPGGNTDST